jgi:hypothetical protein
VPGGGPAGLGEQLRLGHPVAAQPAHQAVVEMQHGPVQLAHEQVDVVAGVADEGHALGVAGQVGRPPSVVADLGQLGVVGQRRAVGGDVVGHKLPEHRPPGRPVGIGVGRTGAGLERRGGGVAGPAGPAQGVQGVVLVVQRVELREQAPVAAPGAGASTARPGARQWSRILVAVGMLASLFRVGSQHYR